MSESFAAALALSRVSIEELMLAVQRVLPQPNERKFRVQMMVHFEAIDSAAFDAILAQRDGQDPTKELAEAKTKHDAFVAKTVRLSADMIAATLAPTPIAPPTTTNEESLSQGPLTAVIMRDMPEASMRMFGALVFAWRLQPLLEALVNGGGTPEQRSSLLQEVRVVSMAGVHLGMTCEFDNSWVLQLTRALHDLGAA